jgi:hypothetical protein
MTNYRAVLAIEMPGRTVKKHDDKFRFLVVDCKLPNPKALHEGKWT